jgi:hypothetical protein
VSGEQDSAGVLQQCCGFGESCRGVVAAGLVPEQLQAVIQQLQQILGTGVCCGECEKVLAGNHRGGHESRGECAESLTSQHGMLLPVFGLRGTAVGNRWGIL